MTCPHSGERISNNISNNSTLHKWFVFTQFKFSNTSIWPIDRTLSGATTRDQIGLGSVGNEGALRILQSPSILKITVKHDADNFGKNVIDDFAKIN